MKRQVSTRQVGTNARGAEGKLFAIACRARLPETKDPGRLPAKNKPAGLGGSRKKRIFIVSPLQFPGRISKKSIKGLIFPIKCYIFPLKYKSEVIYFLHL